MLVVVNMLKTTLTDPGYIPRGMRSLAGAEGINAELSDRDFLLGSGRGNLGKRKLRNRQQEAYKKSAAGGIK
jgi:hypothetical protein